MNGLPQAERKMMAAGISGPEGHAMAHPEVPLQPDHADQDLLGHDDGYEEDHDGSDDHDDNLSHHRRQRQKLLCEHVSLLTRFISSFVTNTTNIMTNTTITLNYLPQDCLNLLSLSPSQFAVTRLGVRCTCLV